MFVRLTILCCLLACHVGHLEMTLSTSDCLIGQRRSSSFDVWMNVSVSHSPSILSFVSPSESLTIYSPLSLSLITGNEYHTYLTVDWSNLLKLVRDWLELKDLFIVFGIVYYLRKKSQFSTEAARSARTINDLTKQITMTSDLVDRLEQRMQIASQRHQATNDELKQLQTQSIRASRVNFEQMRKTERVLAKVDDKLVALKDVCSKQPPSMLPPPPPPPSFFPFMVPPPMIPPPFFAPPFLPPIPPKATPLQQCQAQVIKPKKRRSKKTQPALLKTVLLANAKKLFKC